MALLVGGISSIENVKGLLPLLDISSGLEVPSPKGSLTNGSIVFSFGLDILISRMSLEKSKAKNSEVGDKSDATEVSKVIDALSDSSS